MFLVAENALGELAFVIFIRGNVLTTYYMPSTILSAGEISPWATRQAKNAVLMDLTF